MLEKVVCWTCINQLRYFILQVIGKLSSNWLMWKMEICGVCDWKGVKMVFFIADFKELERMSWGHSDFYINIYFLCIIYILIYNIYSERSDELKYIHMDDHVYYISLYHWYTYISCIFIYVQTHSLFSMLAPFFIQPFFIITELLQLFSNLWSLRFKSSRKKQLPIFQNTQQNSYHISLSLFGHAAIPEPVPVVRRMEHSH